MTASAPAARTTLAPGTVLGDRFDMFPAVIAALPLRIPVAHIHGGERTEGAMDGSLMGMGYLGRFSNIQITDGQMILTR